MEIKESESKEIISKVASLVKVVYSVGTAVIGLVVWLMVMRSDVNANTKTNDRQDRTIEKNAERFEAIIDKLNEIKVELEKKQNK